MARAGWMGFVMRVRSRARAMAFGSAVPLWAACRPGWPVVVVSGRAALPLACNGFWMAAGQPTAVKNVKNAHPCFSGHNIRRADPGSGQGPVTRSFAIPPPKFPFAGVINAEATELAGTPQFSQIHGGSTVPHPASWRFHCKYILIQWAVYNTT